MLSHIKKLWKETLTRNRIAEPLPAPHPTPHPTDTYRDLPPEVRRQRTEQLIAGAQSDVDRWEITGNLHAAWSERASIAATILSDAASVIDIGCGRMDIETHLPASTTYIPADLVRRDERTLICDLNAGVLPDAVAEAAVLLGVLEYVHDAEKTLAELSARWSRIVLSYNPADLDAGRDRSLHGWFNNWKTAQIVAMANNAGLVLQAIVPVDPRQIIFDFQKATQD